MGLSKLHSLCSEKGLGNLLHLGLVDSSAWGNA